MKNLNTAYGLDNPLQILSPFPIISKRDPTANDRGYSQGQSWINESTNKVFVLTSVIANHAIWILTGVGSGDLETLTGNSGGAISPTSGGTINVVGSNGLNVVGTTNTLTISPSAAGFPISTFVVGPSGKAGYQTIASAITAATSGGGTVYIMPGTYTENLTFVNNVNLFGATSADSLDVIIVGTHTPPASGSISFENIMFQSSGSVLSSTAAGTTNIVFNSCLFNINGYVIFANNWDTGYIELNNCRDQGSISNGIFNLENSSGSTDVLIKNSLLGDTETDVGTYSGISAVQIISSVIQCSIRVEGTGGFYLTNSIINAPITTAGSNSAFILNSFVNTGASSAIVHGSSDTLTISNCTISSSNTNAISGSGTGAMVLSTNSFPLSNGIQPTTYTPCPTQVSGIKYAPLATTTSAGNSYMGTVTLVNGTATIGSSVVQANSNIKLWRVNIGSTGANPIGELTPGTISPGMQFVINSVSLSNATTVVTTDVSKVFWEICA